MGLTRHTNPTNGAALTAGFIPDASRVMVGEPLFLTFMVSNRAAQSFQFSHYLLVREHRELLRTMIARSFRP